MVAFLDDNVGDAGLIFLLKTDTGFTNGQQLIVQNLERTMVCLVGTIADKVEHSYNNHM